MSNQAQFFNNITEKSLLRLCICIIFPESGRMIAEQPLLNPAERDFSALYGGLTGSGAHHSGTARIVANIKLFRPVLPILNLTFA